MAGLIEDKDLNPTQLAYKPRTFKQAGYLVEEFDSLTQMKSWLDASPLDETFSRRSIDRSFTGGAKTWAEEKEKIMFGDIVSTEALGKQLSSTASSPLDSPMGIAMGVEGCAYDMGAVISGEPECCLRMDELTPVESIDIYVDIGYCGDVEADTINRRTIAIMKLINQLVLQKVVVNFHLAHYTTVSGKYNLGTVLTIKGTEGLISQVAYLCNPSFFRIVSWNLNEIRCGINGGNACSRPNEDLRRSIKKDGGFYIPGGYVDSFWSDVDNQEEADNHLMESYERFLKDRKVA